jgi:hypothetical protein
MKFVLGLVCGLLALGGYFGYEQYRASKDPCLGRCGEGTSCNEGRCELAEDKVEPKRKRRRRRRRRGRRWRRRRGKSGGAAAAAAEAPKTPSPSQRKMVSSGPSLRSTDYIDMKKGGGGGRELSTAEVTRVFRRLDRRIVACIDKARGDWDLRGGKVVVGFRLERSGRIKKVRVKAPALLQKAGLSRCIAPLVRQLSYPRSSRALVMTYPFRLD